MKNTLKIISLLLLTSLTMLSCETEVTDSTETDEQASTENTEVTESETLIPEGTSIESDHSLDNMCLERSVSDCYIVDYFVEMDVEYITVDFVTYELIEDSKHTDYEAYDLINDNDKLRTFIVNTEYSDCGRVKSIPIQDLIQKYKDDPKTVFSLEAEEGIVNELYIDTCAG